MNKFIIIGVLFLCSLTGCLKEEEQMATEPLVNESVEVFYPEVITAFDNSEAKNFKNDEVIEGEHPEAAKCICKGTGWLPTDGGAVKLRCRYHGKSKMSFYVEPQEQPEINLTKSDIEPLVVEIIEDYIAKRRAQEAKIKATQQPVEEGCTCGPDCKCGPDCDCVDGECLKEQVSEQPKVEEQTSRENSKDFISYQVIVFGADWCAPCIAMKNEITKPLKELGLKVSDKIEADVRFLDIDKNRELYNGLNGGNLTIPMIVEIKNNEVISVKTGKKTFAEFKKLYELER